MILRHLVPVIVFAAAAALSSDASGADVRLYPGVTPQVAVGATAPESLKSLSPYTVEVTGTRKHWLPVSMVKPLGGVTAANFETDLGREVYKIVFEPTKFDVIEGGVTGFTTLQPGRARIGTVTFHARPSKLVAEWGRALVAGTPPLRDVTITLKTANLVATARTFVLRRCALLAYEGDFQSTTITVRPESMQVTGVGAPWLEWINQALSGSATRRDLKVTYTPLGVTVPTATATLKNALLTEVAWGTLDASMKDALNDTFTVIPEMVDPLP